MAAADLATRARRVRLVTCDVDGVLTDGRIHVAENGSELKVYSVLDGLGVKWLLRSGIEVAWITGSDSGAVAQRAAMLGVQRVHQGAEDKLAVWQRLCAALELEPVQCAHIGDDFPDLPILLRCGMAVTVPQAPDALKRRAHYVTKRDGGNGAVRELAELVLSAQGKLDALLGAYGDAADAPSRDRVRRL